MYNYKNRVLACFQLNGSLEMRSEVLMIAIAVTLTGEEFIVMFC